MFRARTIHDKRHQAFKAFHISSRAEASIASLRKRGTAIIGPLQDAISPDDFRSPAFAWPREVGAA